MMHGTQFELQCMCSTFDISSNKFNAEAHARHGGYHSAWWYQQRSNFIRIQLDDDYDINNKLQMSRYYMLLYYRIDIANMNHLRD